MSLISVKQNLLEAGFLEKEVFKLIYDTKKITYMEKKSKKLGQPNATKEIINTILEIAQS